MPRPLTLDDNVANVHRAIKKCVPVIIFFTGVDL
jgi:hypothetical protein